MFIVISVELNMDGICYQNKAALSGVQKLSLLFSNKLFFFFFLCDDLDIFGYVFGSRTPMLQCFKEIVS